MDQQLVSQVAQRAGISPDQATQAAQAVVDYLKGKLPGPIGAQLDSALGGQAGAGSTMGNMGNQIDQSLGGMTGNQQTQQP